MSIKRLLGTLVDSDNKPIGLATFRFVATSTRSTVNTTYTDYPLDANGFYDFEVSLGIYTVQVKHVDETQFRTICANVSVYDEVTQTIEQLIAAQSSVVDPDATVLDEMREILAQAQEAANKAEAAASAVSGALIDLGDFSPASGTFPIPATNPDTSFRSSIWKAVSTGTINAIDFQVGDNLVYSEESSSYYKIDNTDKVTSVGGFAGAVTLEQLELNNVDNTSDADKPISTATQTALGLKADIDHTHNSATQIANGFLSKEDKTKLDSMSPGANNYVHPNSGIVEGTYTKVTYNAQGHATSGTNPNTLAGLGITDAFTKSELSRVLENRYSLGLRDFVSVKDFGAIGDGTRHNVQEWVDQGKFSGLPAIQAVYPHVTSLTDTIDWAATQAALNIVGGSVYQPQGVYVLNKGLDRSNNSVWQGDGVGHWRPGTFNDFDQYTLDRGTNFLMVGTGPKTFTQDFITDSRCMGHVVTNPAPEVTMMDHAEVSGYIMVDSSAAGVPANAPRSKVLQLTNRDTFIFGFPSTSNISYANIQVKAGDIIKVRYTAASSVATASTRLGIAAMGSDGALASWAGIVGIENTGGAWNTIESTWVVPSWVSFVNHWIQVDTFGDQIVQQGWYVAECEMWVNGVSITADGEFALTDLTNQDAIGTTRASLKPFSAAVFSNSRQGGSMSGMRFIPNHPDGGEVYGVGGYRNSSLTTWGDEWDVGLYTASTRSLRLDNVQFVGYWRTAALLSVPLDYGQQRSGLAEMCKYRDCIFQGIRGVSFRDGDLSPVLATTSTSITTRWTKSHRYPTSGVLYIDSKSWTYNSLSYDGSTQLLTFVGGTIPSGLTAGNSLIQQTNSQGIANTTFDGCDITDLSHSSRICEYRPVLGGLFHRPGSAIELSGRNLRGINFSFSSIYTNGPILGHFGRVRNIMLMGNHYEAKTNYVTVGQASGLTGATWIAGGQQGNPDNVGDTDIDNPDNLTGTRTVDVRFLGTSGNDTRIDKSPMIPSKSLASRCRDWNLFNPNQLFDDTNDLQHTGNLAPDQKAFMYHGGGFSWFTPEGYRRLSIDSNEVRLNCPLIFDSTPYLKWGMGETFSFQTVDSSTQAVTTKATIDSEFTLSWDGNIKPLAGNAYAFGTASRRWTDAWFNNLHCVLNSYNDGSTEPSIQGEMTLSRGSYDSVRIKLKDSSGNVKYVNLPVSINGTGTLAQFGITDAYSTSGGDVAGNVNPAATNTYTLGYSSRRWDHVWCNTLHSVLKSKSDASTNPTIQGEMTISRDGYDKIVLKIIDNVGTIRYVNIPVSLNGDWNISTTGNAETANRWTTPRTLGITGDVTGSFTNVTGADNVYALVTLKSTGIIPGTYNSSSGFITPMTFDRAGRLIGTGTPVQITMGWSGVTGKPTTLSGYGITDGVQKNGTRILIPAGDGGSSGGVVKNQSDGVNQASWMCSRYDVSTTHWAIGVIENTGPTYWDSTALRKIYHEGFKPTASDVGAMPISGGTLTGPLNTVMLANNVSDNADTSGDASGFGSKFLESAAANKPPAMFDGALITQSYSDAWQAQIASDWRTNRWYIRSQENGVWKTWGELYSTVNKPTASDVGAAPSGYGLGTDPFVARGSINVIRYNGWQEYNGDAGDTGGPIPYGTVLHVGHKGNATNYAGWASQLFMGVNGGMYFRATTAIGSFTGSPWQQVYSTGNKPTANDVGALSTSGGSVAGNINPGAVNTYNLGASNVRWDNLWVNKIHNVLAAKADTATDPTVQAEMTLSRDGYTNVSVKLLDNLGVTRFGNIPVSTDGNHSLADYGITNGYANTGGAIAGDAYPSSANTYKLGTSTVRWDKVWCNTVHSVLQAEADTTTDPTIQGEMTITRYGYDKVTLKVRDNAGVTRFTRIPVSTDGNQTLASYNITDGYSKSGGEINGDVIPLTTNTRSFGSSARRWLHGWINTLHSVLVSSSNTTTDPTIQGEMTISRNGYDKVVIKLMDDAGVTRSVTLTLT